jgi:TonB family protein
VKQGEQIRIGSGDGCAGHRPSGHASHRSVSYSLRGAGVLLALLAVLLFSAPRILAAFDLPVTAGGRRTVSQQNGVQTIRDGQRVRVTLEMGDVHVLTQTHGEVRYRLRVEAPASSVVKTAAQAPFELTARGGSEGVNLTGRNVRGQPSDRFWVTLELEVPRSTPLEISTQGGNIDVQDIDGRLVLESAGGNLSAGKVGASARLQTAGGHIAVQDVAGDLVATTGGGHIAAGYIQGDAQLTSSGGHIRAARVDGTARLITRGGNIFLDHSGARLVASSGGGRIVVGEATGELDARSEGGGVRVWRVAGPAQIATTGGAIYLTGISSRVRASTAAGGITARFASPAAVIAPHSPQEKSGPPQAAAPVVATTLGEFQCSGGDITVFLPKEMGITLDAAIEGGENFRILVDPALELKLNLDEASRGRLLRAAGALQGGGPLLRLRATAGNILLRSDDGSIPPPSPPGAPLPPGWRGPGARRGPMPPTAPLPPGAPLEDLDASLARMESSLTAWQYQNELQQEMFERSAVQRERVVREANRIAERAQGSVAAARAQAEGVAPAKPGREMGSVDYNWNQEQLSPVEGLSEKLTAWLTDRIIVPGDQMRGRLMRRVDPVYPDTARELGLEGTVRIRVAVGRDGSVEDVKALSGNPVLAEAAVSAIRQWRYRPTVLNGQQMPVLTILTVSFHRP